MNLHVLSLSIRSRMFLIVAVVTLLAIPQVLPAAPVKLQFEGTVRRVDSGGTPIPQLAQLGIHAGSSVSFTYIVDLAADGHLANSTPRVDTTWYDYFHAEQVGGLRILGSAATDTAHSGYRDKYWNQTHIQAGSSLEFNDWWSSQEVLPIGQYFYVGQYFYGSGGALYPNGYGYTPYALVRYDLTLTSMSAVPVPGALWLLGSGLLGLLGIRSRFSRKD